MEYTYKVIYNHSYYELVKYRAKEYFGEWKTNHFLFNIDTRSNENVITKYFEPLFLIDLFGQLYTDQTIVVNVRSINNTNHDQGDKDLDNMDTIFYDLILYKQDSKGVQKTTYSYYKWITTRLINDNLVTITSFDIRKNSCVIIQKNRYQVDQYTVYMDNEELGFYKPVMLKSLCKDCIYYNPEVVLYCAVNPFSESEVKLICNDYTTKVTT